MRATICEFSAQPTDLEPAWTSLAEHVRQESSELVLLPEMCFAPWLPATRPVRPEAWAEAVQAHERWLERLPELGARVVAGTRPVVDGGRRLNEAFVWDADTGIRGVHAKTYLPDEPGFWEKSWYERGPTTFEPVDTPLGRLGFMVCTELWFLQHARTFAAANVDVILCPRATPAASVEKWVAGGRVAGVCAGAFCLSSNRSGTEHDVSFGGVGWATDPDAKVLARTDSVRAFATLDVDLRLARGAKRTYPRYVDASPVPEPAGAPA